jgi:hypothetical protein
VVKENAGTTKYTKCTNQDQLSGQWSVATIAVPLITPHFRMFSTQANEHFSLEGPYLLMCLSHVPRFFTFFPGFRTSRPIKMGLSNAVTSDEGRGKKYETSTTNNEQRTTNERPPF